MRSDMEDCEARNAFGFHSSHGNAIHASDDHSINKTMPWIVLVGILAGVSLGISLWAIDQAKDTRTQLLLLREDNRQLSIEVARGK